MNAGSCNIQFGLVLITAGSSGLSLAVARQLAGQYPTLHIVSREGAKAEQAPTQLASHGPRVHGHRLNAAKGDELGNQASICPVRGLNMTVTPSIRVDAVTPIWMPTPRWRE